MPSINTYIANLKNVAPGHLDGALKSADISVAAQKEVLENVWHLQRAATMSETKASELTFLSDQDFEDGVWIEHFDLKGQLTDAFKEAVGLVEEQRVTAVVNGKLKRLNPDDIVQVYRTPEVPVGD